MKIRSAVWPTKAAIKKDEKKHWQNITWTHRWACVHKKYCNTVPILKKVLAILPIGKLYCNINNPGHRIFYRISSKLGFVNICFNQLHLSQNLYNSLSLQSVYVTNLVRVQNVTFLHIVNLSEVQIVSNSKFPVIITAWRNSYSHRCNKFPVVIIAQWISQSHSLRSHQCLQNFNLNTMPSSVIALHFNGHFSRWTWVSSYISKY